MKNFGIKRAFTIAELTVATLVIAGIAMILMPSLVSNNQNQILMTALNKTNTDLQQVYRSMAMLEAQGRLRIDRSDMAGTFLNAINLTEKTVPQAKFNEYRYTSVPANTGIGGYTDWRAGGNTIILKNTMYISRVNANTIVVDVNGRKLPNKTGEDIYFFFFNTITAGVNRGEIFFGGNCTDASCNAVVETCTKGDPIATSGGCAAKYLKEGKIQK